MDLHTLNAAILEIAPAHDAREDAPACFPNLARCASRLVLPVWCGASGRTVYRDPRVNWASRAWHDATHLALQADFTIAGETAVCEAQVLAFKRRFPSSPDWVARLIRAEVIGQVTYAAEFGRFPEDQAGFTLSLIAEENHT